MTKKKKTGHRQEEVLCPPRALCSEGQHEPSCPNRSMSNPEKKYEECFNCGCQRGTHPIPECKTFFSVPQDRKAVRSAEEIALDTLNHVQFKSSNARATAIKLMANAIRSERQTQKEYVEALEKAYEINQNMHCYKTSGKLNEQLNEQTRLLRDALKQRREK